MHCIPCFKDLQEEEARQKGVHNSKLKKERFENGQKFCGECVEWKNTSQFGHNKANADVLSRWCKNCTQPYMQIYHLRKKYGMNFQELHLKDINHLIDIQGNKWDSMDEKHISNWLILNNVEFRKGPFYREVLPIQTNHQFEWIVKIKGKEYLVEYFGLWDAKSKSESSLAYAKVVKRKVKWIYKNGLYWKFIAVFPVDLRKKKLDDIFSQSCK